MKIKEFIAYCGLDCEACEARMAAINNDDTLREKVAKLWSELNSAEATACETAGMILKNHEEVRRNPGL